MIYYIHKTLQRKYLMLKTTSKKNYLEINVKLKAGAMFRWSSEVANFCDPSRPQVPNLAQLNILGIARRNHKTYFEQPLLSKVLS